MAAGASKLVKEGFLVGRGLNGCALTDAPCGKPVETLRGEPQPETVMGGGATADPCTLEGEGGRMGGGEKPERRTGDVSCSRPVPG